MFVGATVGEDGVATEPHFGRANLLPAALAAGRFTSILTDSHVIPPLCASVAQLAEQLICNQQVVGSSPSASSS